MIPPQSEIPLDDDQPSSVFQEVGPSYLCTN